MSLLSPLERAIADVFKSNLLEQYVTDKLNEDEDTPKVPKMAKDQLDDDWRLSAINLLGERTLDDPIFNIRGRKLAEEACVLKGKLLVDGAPYYVFPGEMSAETVDKFITKFGNTISPRAVNNSIRCLIKKNYDRQMLEQAKLVASLVSQSNRVGGNQRGYNHGRGRGREGNQGRSGWQAHGARFNGGKQGYHQQGPWRMIS
jgi:hypothetical protein